MYSIIRATVDDAVILREISIQSFIESHGISASEEDINTYVTEKYTLEVIEEELKNEKNIYNILYVDGEASGFSKIILNQSFHQNVPKPVAKLERIYLLQSYYGKQFGNLLFNQVIDYMKANEQTGMWLYVWINNHRALSFYKKMGFVIIGSAQFKISDQHYNPNYILYRDV